MKTSALVAVLLVSALPVSAQQLPTSLLPAAYYTSGSYSNGNRSDSYAGYATVSLRGLDYIVAGYDGMTIQSSGWTYNQQLIVVGGMKNFYPFYAKVNIGRIDGTFRIPGQQYSYEDQTDILNGGLLYNADLLYFGATYTFMSVRGYSTVRCHQLGLQGDWLIDPALRLSVRPLYTRVTDGRSLISVTGEVTYVPWQSLLLQVSGMMGKRAYYFNPDHLTVFNQDETQKSLIAVRTEYTFTPGVTLIGSYQSAGFLGYSVRYATIGGRVRIPL
jgi:hypothetical protein